MRAFQVYAVMLLFSSICDGHDCLDLLPYDTIIADHSKWTSDNYKKRLVEFKFSPIAAGDVVFIGDSHIQVMGDWNQKLEVTNAKNRGIGGDITEGVMVRLEEVICSGPSKIYLLIGTNDILWTDKTDKELADGIQAIVKQLREGLPETELVLHTIMPINKTWSKKSVDHAAINAKITKVNNRLETIDDPHVQLIKLNDIVSDSEGFLKAQYTRDGVHLNDVGRKVWIKAIKESL
ncbi:MAG: GDSL-type esterase/lipase family protein [Cyclobacteriaceae bacterium]